MPETVSPTPATESAPPPSDHETFHVPDEDFRDLASTLAKTIAEVRRHGVVLDRLTAEPRTATAAPPGTAPAPATAMESLFIVAMGSKKYATELAALTDWVTHLLLPVYGREISTTRPWCDKWHEHPEAVARLHALWLAWQQLIDAEAGLTGPSTWHRDHLDHTLAQLRSPDGPFAACTTSPARPTHRVLATPAPERGEAAA